MVAGDGREWPGVGVGGQEWPGVAGDDQGVGEWPGVVEVGQCWTGAPMDFMQEI